MKNVLIVNNALPHPMNHGGHLRVANLARALNGRCRVYLTAFDGTPEALAEVAQSGIFERLFVLPKASGKSFLARVFRTSNASYFRLSHPGHFRQILDRLSEVIRDYDIDTVIAGHLNVAEYVAALQGVRKIVDDFDCQTLTMEREYRVERNNMSLRHRYSSLLQRYRVRRHESTLGEDFDLVTTIAKPDQERLQQIARRQSDSIHVVPNGVDSSFLVEPDDVEEIDNAVVFWGNLAFPPNYSAVKYFYESFFLPFLEARGVKWYILGPEADQWMQSLHQRHVNIEVPGFIEDLHGFAARMPVVVNPMIMGSGLKNKVLEAFALRKAVVSTRMGVEALEGCDDSHCIVADEPRVFADAVLGLLDSPADRAALGDNARQLVIDRYTWESVGRRWVDLVAPGPGEH